METSHPSLLDLKDEERMFRESVRRFASQEVTSRAASMDRAGLMDPALIAQCFQLGLMGIEIPESYGGSGGSFFMAILAVEELSRADAAVGVAVDVQNTLVNNAVLRWGSDEQKQKYLPQLATGMVGAYALSEAVSGSDAFALQTRATRQGSHYLLNGRKLWITNAAEAGLFIVFATIDPALGYKGISAFLVERTFPGFSLGRKEDKLGIRASSTCELVLENCLVPQENLLGEAGKGYRISIETLNEGRIGIGAQMVGLSQGALDAALAYAQEREQFGQSIAAFQAVRFDLARMATNLEAARLMVYNAARLKESGEPFAKEAAMAKYLSSEIAERLTSLAVEIFGGYGYTKDYPVEKFYRDAKIGKIYEGTSNMQLQTIAKMILPR